MFPLPSICAYYAECLALFARLGRLRAFQRFLYQPFLSAQIMYSADLGLILNFLAIALARTLYVDLPLSALMNPRISSVIPAGRLPRFLADFFAFGTLRRGFISNSDGSTVGSSISSFKLITSPTVCRNYYIKARFSLTGLLGSYELTATAIVDYSQP